MKQVIVSHAGKQHSYHVAKTLFMLNRLDKFYTSSYVRPKWLQEYLLGIGNTFWSRRFLSGLHGEKVESNWRFEVKEMWYQKLYGQNRATMSAVFDRDMSFDRFMAGRMFRLPGEIYWGFQGSSYLSLQAARQSGKISVCELSSGHAPAARRIFEEERDLHPEWSDSIDTINFPTEYYRRISDEPKWADYVVGATQFTLQTLREDGVDETKLRCIPLGFEIGYIPFAESADQHQRSKRPIKLLFVGRITQRKGIKYLLEAMKCFDASQVELHIIGYIEGSGKGLAKYKNYTLHPPMQQYELFRRYHEFDLLVFPSLFEGFGLVVVEAMAAGLPVIATPHTVGPELITPGENGYLVPIRDVDSIVTAIADFISKPDEEIRQMRKSAREAALHFSWDQYAERLSDFLTSIEG